MTFTTAGTSIGDRQATVTQAILMSVYRSRQLRGPNPTPTIAHAFKTYAAGALPRPA